MLTAETVKNLGPELLAGIEYERVNSYHTDSN